MRSSARVMLRLAVLASALISAAGDPGPSSADAGARRGGAIAPAVARAGPDAGMRDAGGSGAPSLFPWEAARRASVPSPESVLGHALGERVVDPAGVQAYLDALASAAPERVRVYSYARSHEGRPLRYAVISSAANIARLAEHRAAVRRLGDPAGLSAPEIDALVRTTPAIVWLAYAVHGNEISSTEAALATAWHLASAEDERTARVLDAALVVIDPLQNPDGRERFVAFQRQVSGPSLDADPWAVEHDEPWPSGRFNHGLFDLNRDWAWLAQPETRGKVAAFLAWRPQVFVDFHEMGTESTYYFAPPARPINPNVAASTLRWFKAIGDGNARVFDALGFDYFTEEVFDLFYPGYGDSWPALQGTIGMTYEEAAPRGLAIERRDGSILTLREAIRRHVAAGLATAETVAVNREAILRDYAAARRAAVEDGASGSVKAYLIPPGAGADDLAGVLAAEGIEVARARQAFTARAAPEGDGPAAPRSFPAGTLIAPLAQPSGRLLAALFDRDPRIDERALAEARERRRLRAELPFYDVTAWSVALAWNLPVFAATEPVAAAADPVPRGDVETLPGHATPPAGTAPWPAALRLSGPSTPAPRASYAYLLPPAGESTMAAMAALVGDPDLRVQVAAKGFTLGGRAYPAGTAVLKVGRNPVRLHAAVAREAERTGATFEAVATGLTEEGIDLGSNSVQPVRRPRIAVAYGEPVSPTSVGAVRHVLEERLGVPLTAVRADSLARAADLDRWDVLLLPDGPAGGYREAFGPQGIPRLRAWIEAGGTLVAWRGAAAFVADKDLDWTSSRLVKKPRSSPVGPAAPEPTVPGAPGGRARPEKASAAGGEAAAPVPAGSTASPPSSGAPPGDAGAEEAPDEIPGAILRVILEPSSPLAFGYAGELPALITSNLVFSLSKEGVNAGVFAPRERLRLGGFAWTESLDLLAGKAFAVTEPMGDGRVVLIADDPVFRGGWRSLVRLLFNAIYLVPSLDR